MSTEAFFRALPHQVLAAFREKYLEEGPSDEDSLRRATVLGLKPEEVDAIAGKLAAKLDDRQWVREQLKHMPRSHHVALIALLQCQGVAGGTWLLQELTQAHGMSEDLWAEVLHNLGNDLWVFGNSRQSPPLFYITPQALGGELAHQFRKRLTLRPARDADDVELSKDINHRHPVGFSLVSFLVYIRQNQVKVTRADEIFKKHRDEMAEFFRNLWGEGLEHRVLDWHLDFVQDLGLVRHRGGHLAVDDLALREYLGMSPVERRDLYLAYFRRKEPLLLWVLQMLSEIEAGEWVSAPKLRTLYRRRYMGNIYHRRYVKKSYYMPPSGYYEPVPPLEHVQVPGLVEGGSGDGGSFIRLTQDGRVFMSGEDVGALEANEGVKFLLQPTFEVLAPVGLPLQTVWKLGEVAELRRVDRANTFVLTRDSVRSALDAGWRADDLLGFLGEASQVGVPQNVETTIRDWVGSHGEVELHDALVIRAPKSRFKVLVKVLKKLGTPHEVLSDGVAAIPRELRDEVVAALREAELDVAPRVRTHDLADAETGREGPLHALLRGEEDSEEGGLPAHFPTKSLVMLGAPAAEGGNEAVASRGFRSGRVGANAVGADISLKPAAAGAGDLLKLSPGKTMSVIKAAIRLRLDVEVLYPSTGDDDPGGLARVTPTEVTELGGSSHFTGRHHRLDRELQFQIKRIKGIRLAT
jgi:hypothetical protein